MGTSPRSSAPPTQDIGSGAEIEFTLTLFVSGASDRSGRAIADATAFCDKFLSGSFRFSVVDINDDSAAALRDGVVAVPTLVKELPLPVRRVVGDLSDTDRVLLALGLSAAIPAEQDR